MGNGKVWRRRSAASLADEVESLTRRFHFNRFKFIDDQFILTNKEGHEFAEAFGAELGRRNLQIKFSIACRANNIERNLFLRLREIGLEKIFVGVEAGHQRGLDTFDKETTVEMNDQALATLRELGLKYDMGFILVDAYTTYDELRQNLLYLIKHKNLIKAKGSYLSVTPSLVAYGGTPIYDRLVSEGRLLGDFFNGFYYQIADKDVRRFLFIMERIFDDILLKVFNRLLFAWHDLRRYVVSLFKPRPIIMGPNHSLGGKSHENASPDGLLLSHHPAMESIVEHPVHLDLVH